jgi:hypothetical protein
MGGIVVVSMLYGLWPQQYDFLLDSVDRKNDLSKEHQAP